MDMNMNQELDRKLMKAMRLLGAKQFHGKMRGMMKPDRKAFGKRLLAIVQEHPEITMEDFLTRFDSHKENVEKLVAKLVEKELLVIGAENEKGQRPLSLTEKGTQEAADAFAGFAPELTEVWAGFSEEELALLSKCFDQIVAVCQEEGDAEEGERGSGCAGAGCGHGVWFGDDPRGGFPGHGGFGRGFHHRHGGHGGCGGHGGRGWPEGFGDADDRGWLEDFAGERDKD